MALRLRRRGSIDDFSKYDSCPFQLPIRSVFFALEAVSSLFETLLTMRKTWLWYRRRKRRRRSIEKGVYECLLKAPLATITLTYYISFENQVAINYADIKNVVL
jgi:hypothetical protein